MISGWRRPGSWGIWKSDLGRRGERRVGRSLRPRPRQKSAGGIRAGLRQACPRTPAMRAGDQQDVSGSSDLRACPGREGHFGAAGSVCRDGEGKPWTPPRLRRWAAPKGVGVTFLEETFSAADRSARASPHQKAAQAVLKALLPETGTDIKGQMRSRQELLEASGYANRPRDFDDLIHILDSGAPPDHADRPGRAGRRTRAEAEDGRIRTRARRPTLTIHPCPFRPPSSSLRPPSFVTTSSPTTIWSTPCETG